jgi:hypothetical protein
MLVSVSVSARGQSFPFEQTVPVGAATVLDVATERGRINVQVGEPGHVVVKGTVSVRIGWNVPANAADLAKAAASHPPIEEEGATIRLRPPTDAAVRDAVTVAYDVLVPPDTTLISASDSGATNVDGVRRAVSVRTQSGAITLANLGGDGEVTSGSGSVAVRGVQRNLRVSTQSSGIVATDLSGSLYARTGSGRIHGSLNGREDVDVRTESSTITLQGLNGSAVAHSDSGRISLRGNPRLAWEISSGSGSLDIDLSADAPAMLDLTTKSGSIDVPPGLVTGHVDKRRVSGAIRGGGALVRVTSRSGSIRVK